MRPPETLTPVQMQAFNDLSAIAINHSMFFIYYRTDKDVEEGAGGFPIRIGNRQFIITCHHVAKHFLGNPRVRFSFPVFVLDQDTQTKGGLLLVNEILHFKDALNEKIDLAVFEMNGIPDDRCTDISQLSLERVGTHGFVAGQPGDLVEKNEDNPKRIDMTPNCTLVPEYPNFRVPFTDDFWSYFFEYPKYDYDLSGSEVKPSGLEVPSMQGMSGSAIYSLDLNNPDPLNSKVLGVQQSQAEGIYFRAIPIGYALALIYGKYTNLPDPFGMYEQDKNGLRKYSWIPKD